MALDRRIIVPCLEWTPDAAVRAEEYIGGDREERGPQPGIAVRDPESSGSVDLFLAKHARIPVRRHVEGEVLVHSSGDLEKGKFLWRRPGDPYWKGKSDHCDLAHAYNVFTDTGTWIHHPYLVPMSNGELLILWASNVTSDTTDTNWIWRSRVFTPTHGLTAIVRLPSLHANGIQVERVPGGGVAPQIPSICAAEDPSYPGRIVAVGLGDASNDGTPSAGAVDFVVFTSYDYGRTWRISSFQFQMITGTNYSYGASLAFAGGRLVLAVQRATDNVGVWYSNDLGNSWTAATVPSGSGGGGGATLVRLSNGGLLVFYGVAAGGNNLGVKWSGDNGATWSNFVDPAIQVLNADSGTKGYWPAAFVDDAGFPCVYWTAFLDGATDYRGLLFTRGGKRAYTYADTQKATNVFDDGSEQRVQQVVWDDDPTLYDTSVREVAACNWRGRAAVLLQYEDTTRRGLALCFAAQWCDLRYKVLPTRVSAAFKWRYDYLPLGLPNDYGTAGYAWTLSGVATTAHLVEGGGFYMVDGGASAHQYTSPALGATPRAVRFVVRVHSGGSVTGNNVAFEAASNAENWRWRVRLATTGFALYDVNGAVSLADAVATDLTQWHEFVVVVPENGERGQLYWRKLDPEGDEHPAFNEVFDLENDGGFVLDTGVEATDLLLFGHASGANAVSEWRDVAHHLTQDVTLPVSRWDEADAFQLWSALYASFTSSDLACEMSERPIHLADGLAATFTGATGIGGDRWEFETRAEHALSLACEGGPTRGWMAVRNAFGASEGLELLFDAGQDRKFRADAIALFGCNWPAVFVQMNDADYWETGVPVEAEISFRTADAARYERIRSATPAMVGSRVVAVVDGNAVSLTGANMMPHQYRPRGTRVWYCSPGYGETNTGHVWRIEDNSETALYLKEAPAGQIVVGDDLVVFSDRIAYDLTKLTGLTKAIGYRYLRVSIPKVVTVVHDGSDGPKIGRIVLGRMWSLSDPEWGFSIETTPGVGLVRGRGGQVVASEFAPELDRYALTWPPRVPLPRDRDDVVPERDTWQYLRNILRATKYGLDSCVLVLDAYLSDHSDYDRVSGDDLALVRLVGGLDLKHQSYFPVEAVSGSKIPSGLTDQMDDPAFGLGGVVFEEEA